MTTPTKRREEEEGYIPPGDAGTMAAIERFHALPPEQRAARREEGLALRDAYMEGYGTPPPEDVAFSRPDGTRWAMEQPADAQPASMADLRRMEDAPPAVPARAQDWGDGRPGGASMASAQELDDAGMLGNGRRVIRTPEMQLEDPPPRVIRLPEMDVSPKSSEPRVIQLPEMHISMGDEPRQDWQDAGASRPAPQPTAAPATATAPRTTPRRPMVDVSQVGQANPGGLFDRLAAAARAPMRPMGQSEQGINPEVRAFVEKRAAPADGLQQAQGEERDRRLAEAIWRAGAGVNTALTGAKAPEGVDFDVEAPKREFAERQAEDVRKTEVARQAALRDPNSPESIRQRAALKAVLPNIPNDVLAGVTAENASRLFDTLKFGASEATRKAEAEKEAARYASEQEYRRGRDTTEDAFKRAQFGAQADERRLRREELAEQRAYARNKAENATEAKADQQKMMAETGLRKEFASLPEVKEFSGLSTSYQTLISAAEDQSGPGGVATIFNFMKMIDPGVAVMQGDVDLIRNSGGPAAKFANLYEQALSGNPLPPKVRADLVRQATTIYNNRKAQVDALGARYSSIAGDMGVSPERVVFNRAPDINLEKPAPAPAAPQKLADVPMLSLAPGQKLTDAIQEGQVYRVRTKNGVRLMAKRGGELVYED